MHPGAMAATTTGPDKRTSLSDIRTLSCILAGVPHTDIHPATGHELTERAYLNARNSWADHITTHGLTTHTRPAYNEARAYWAKHRPEHMATHPWPHA